MKKSIFLIIPFMLAACSPTLRYAKESASSSSDYKLKESSRWAEVASNFEKMEALESFIGTASFYADKYNGRKTANGEIYNMLDLTAAHISYPFNTICRVTNLKNQKSVIVRINDRKPDTNNRAIDLSLGTAKEIDMVNDGLAEVKIEILEWGGE